MSLFSTIGSGGPVTAPAYPVPAREDNPTPRSGGTSDPGGSGATPAGTGAASVNAPSAVEPAPNTTPPPSNAETARVVEQRVAAQQAAREVEQTAVDASAEDAARVEPSGRDATLEARGRDDVPAPRSAGAEDAAKRAAEAEQGYRDANETTSAIEPAQLMVTA